MEQNIDKAFIITQKIKRPKTGKAQSKIEALYEQVIQKNFQTIDQLLKKLTYIITRHDDFETQFQTFTKRLAKFQSDLESIHNEHRRNNLHIISNINGIRTEIVGIDTHIKLLFDQVKYKGVGSFLGNRPGDNIRETCENRGSVISSAHKLSDNSSMLNFDAADEDSLTHKSEKESQHTKRGSSNLEILPLFNNILFKSNSRKTIVEEKRESSLHVSVNQYASTKLIESVKKQEVLKSTRNEKSVEEKLMQNSREKLLIESIQKQKQKKEESQIISYLSKLTNMLDSDTETKQNTKQKLVASFAKHRTKIASIFKLAKERSIDPLEMKSNFCQIIDQIISEDETLTSKIKKSNQPHRISREISQILYEKIFDQEQRIQEQAKVSAKEVEDKVKESFKKDLQGLNTRVSDLEQKSTIIVEFNQKCKENVRKLMEEFEHMKETSKNFATQQQLFNEAFKIIQKSQKKWQDFHYHFANKQETSKAISFISSKISSLMSMQGNGVAQVDQKSQNLQTKCLCCTQSVHKSPTARPNPPTARTSHHSIQIVKRVRPNELKKKALEVLKNPKTREEQSRSFCIY